MSSKPDHCRAVQQDHKLYAVMDLCVRLASLGGPGCCLAGRVCKWAHGGCAGGPMVGMQGLMMGVQVGP